MAGFNLFGFELVRSSDLDKLQQSQQPPIAPQQSDDGAISISSSAVGGYYGTYLNLETAFKDENDLISRYRAMAMQPEVEQAVDEVVNESIVHDENGKTVEIILDELPYDDGFKEIIRNEFKEVIKLLDFSNNGADVFRRWYVDGRLFYQVQINNANPKLGITGLVYLDPRKVRKVKTVTKQKDPRTGIEVVGSEEEFYLYSDAILKTNNNVVSNPIDAALKIAPDAIVNINSGLMDVTKNIVLSYLHKAIKPMNQLRMIEDAVVIYRLSRAPERRVFYIDVGNLPKQKADQYLQSVMTKFRNKIVYDANTGEVRDDRRFMSMIEDFWLPRRGEGKSTEITTLPPGQNLGELSDVKYFEQKLYKSLGVPVSRLESQQGFTLGRSTEITRDELRFSKFVERLRNRFSVMFDELMKRQLSLKGIASPEEWDEMKEHIHYDFLKDNNFAELKDAELLTNRVLLLNSMVPYVGSYYSMNWVRKNVLHLTEDEIKQMDEEIESEQEKMAQMNLMQQAQAAALGSQPMQPAQGINNTSTAPQQ
jgi:Bacteriophage T4-like portal protein (Gp20)